MPSLSQRLRQKPVDAELDRWVPRSQDGVPLPLAQLEDAELLERQGETRPVAGGRRRSGSLFQETAAAYMGL